MLRLRWLRCDKLTYKAPTFRLSGPEPDRWIRHQLAISGQRQGNRLPILVALVFQQIQEIASVATLDKRLSAHPKLLISEEALAPRNFLRCTNLQPLPVFYGADEVGGVAEVVECSRVEPRGAPGQDLDLKVASLQICL